MSASLFLGAATRMAGRPTWNQRARHCCAVRPGIALAMDAHWCPKRMYSDCAPGGRHASGSGFRHR